MTNNLARRIWDYRNSLNFCNFGRHKNFIYVATFELKDEETAKAMENIAIVLPFRKCGVARMHLAISVPIIICLQVTVPVDCIPIIIIKIRNYWKEQQGGERV